MDIFSLFHTDRNAEISGVERTIPTKAGPLVLRIARFGNPNFQKKFRELQTEYQARLDAAKDNEEELEALSSEVLRKVVASSILVGWPDKNDLTYKGEKVGKYSVKAAEQLLEANGFLDLVQKLSQETDEYLTVKQAAAAKN